jgi:hypothetical protein
MYALLYILLFTYFSFSNVSDFMVYLVSRMDIETDSKSRGVTEVMEVNMNWIKALKQTKMSGQFFYS